MKVTYQNFRNDKYFFFKYFLFQMLATTALLATIFFLKGMPGIMPNLSFKYLLLLPVAFWFGVQVPVILHNAVHFNIKPKALNEIVGELCGFFVLFGMGPFRISHVLHHAHADTERDTHPPMGKSFIHFLATTQLNTVKVISNEYFEKHGRTPETYLIMGFQMSFYYIGLVSRLLCWFIALKPTLFCAFFIPAYMTNLIVFAHINFATHETQENGEVVILNLNHNWYYKLINAIGSGSYFHKNHHMRPGLYNPSLMNAVPAKNPIKGASSAATI